MSRRAKGEGSIFRRKDGRWVGRTQNDAGARFFVYGKTQREVREQLTVIKRGLQQGITPITGRMTLARYLESWLVESVQSTVRESTFVSYRSIVRNHLVTQLGKVQLAKLTPQMVERFLNERLATGLSPRRVQYLHAVLRIALNRAMKAGYVGRNVAMLVDPPRVPHNEIAPLTPSQARTLLEAAKGDRMEALYSVALALGLRQGEALGLRWEDVDFESGLIHVRFELQRIDRQSRLVELKTRRSHRTLAIPPYIAEQLREHAARQREERIALGPEWQKSDFVFTSGTGRPLLGTNVTRAFQRLLKRAGLPKRRFYDLRHSCATLLLVQGVPARVVMEILGHSQIGLTMNTYTHVVPELSRAAANGMQKFLVGDRKLSVS
jgi:integrase